MLEEDPTNQLDLGEGDEEEREEGRGEEGVDGGWEGQRDDGGVTQGRRPSRQTKKGIFIHFLGSNSFFGFRSTFQLFLFTLALIPQLAHRM